MAGSQVSIEWRGRRAQAWLPAPLVDSEAELSTSSVRSTERAAAAVIRLGDRLPAAWEPLARLMLRAEGMASSNIEGVRAPIAAVAAAPLRGAGGAAGWVADNLETVTQALAATGADLTISTLHQWHAALMRHSTLPQEMIGAARKLQNWIGGTSPLDAVFVPPPAMHVAPLLEDLVAYSNRDDIDPVHQAALAHAQFETIHPYADGNGRIGRVLVLWILARRLQVAAPPPMSTVIARDIGGYLSGLHLFRSGSVEEWIRWFAGALQRSGDQALEWLSGVEQVVREWRSKVEPLRIDAAARRLVETLPAHPVISVEVASEAAGVSRTAALTALKTLAELGILQDLDAPVEGMGRPARLWVSREMVDQVEQWL